VNNVILGGDNGINADPSWSSSQAISVTLTSLHRGIGLTTTGFFLSSSAR
jgi:hypothetical protein